MNIVLIGFMGTGKSAVGRALALRLGAGFLDTDAEIEREAGKPIRHIFAEDGEPAFRAMETALARLASSGSPRNWGRGGSSLVLATGGGTPLREDNVAPSAADRPRRLADRAARAILQRVGPDLSLRPLLAAFQDDPLARIQTCTPSARPHYEAVADLTCDTSLFATPDAVADFLANELCRPDAKPSRLPTEKA